MKALDFIEINGFEFTQQFLLSTVTNDPDVLVPYAGHSVSQIQNLEEAFADLVSEANDEYQLAVLMSGRYTDDAIDEYHKDIISGKLDTSGYGHLRNVRQPPTELDFINTLPTALRNPLLHIRANTKSAPTAYILIDHHVVKTDVTVASLWMATKEHNTVVGRNSNGDATVLTVFVTAKMHDDTHFETVLLRNGGDSIIMERQKTYAEAVAGHKRVASIYKCL